MNAETERRTTAWPLLAAALRGAPLISLQNKANANTQPMQIVTGEETCHKQRRGQTDIGRRKESDQSSI